MQGVIGVHQQHSVGGINFAVGLEGIKLAVEHLHPGMGHGASGVHAVQLVGDGAGGAVAAADIGCSGTQNGGIRSLGPAGAEFQHRPALGGTDHPVGLGGDEALMVDAQKQERLNQLGLDGRGPDRDDRLLGEDRRSLRHGPDVAGEAEIGQILQEFLAEQVPATEIFNVLRVKMQVPDIPDNLLQTRRNGKAAAVGTLTEEHIEIADAVLVAPLKVAVAHGQLIEVAEHGEI